MIDLTDVALREEPIMFLDINEIALKKFTKKLESPSNLHEKSFINVCTTPLSTAASFIRADPINRRS